MIKFRAWDKFYECMINPAGIELENGEVAHIIEQLPGETTKSSITYYELMQSTGLKDKNGMEIFEGDVVKVKAEDPAPKMRADRHEIGVITYAYGSFDIETKPNTVSGLIPESHLSDIKLTYEVVGNIYENGDLLK